MVSSFDLNDSNTSSPSVAALVLTVSVVGCFISAVTIHLIMSHFFASNSRRPNAAKKQRGPVCPFSAETNFIVETAEDLPPAPLDLFESWSDPKHPDFGKPLAARWLNAGISGQDTAGVLRAGLKRLRDSKFFLVEEPFRMKEELQLKKKALDDTKRYREVFVAEKDSVDAQREVLDLFLSYLPKRYPELYKLDRGAKTLYVTPIEASFQLDNWNDRPLELCERIVQEDLILMRPPKKETDGESSQYAMAAAGVIFSFAPLAPRLGKSLEFIHAPVPGYARYLRKTLNLTFAKLLKIEQPMWRNNWSIHLSGQLDQPDHYLFDTSFKPTLEEIKTKYLKVEYQTLRRLPKSGYVLFTVKSMVDPLSSLEKVPQAASCLAKSIRGLSAPIRVYKGIPNDETCEMMLEYLDSISES